MSDPAVAYLLGELTNSLTTAQLALADMVRIANDFDFEPTVDTADSVLVRKTIAARAVIATVEKALEVCGGAGFYRKLGLERLLRDAHGAQFHPLPEKRQQLFTGRRMRPYPLSCASTLAALMGLVRVGGAFGVGERLARRRRAGKRGGERGGSAERDRAIDVANGHLMSSTGSSMRGLDARRREMTLGSSRVVSPLEARHGSGHFLIWP